PGGKIHLESHKSPGINPGLPTRTPEINGFGSACQPGTPRSMTFKSPVNSGNTHPRQPKTRCPDSRSRPCPTRMGPEKSNARALRKRSQTHVKRAKTHVGCSSNARGHGGLPRFHRQAKERAARKDPPPDQARCTPARPSRGTPRQTRQGATRPPDQAGCTPARPSGGCSPARPGRGPPPAKPGGVHHQTSPLVWRACLLVCGSSSWFGGPPSSRVRDPLVRRACTSTPAKPLAKTPINRGAGPSFGPPASRGAKLSRGDPRLRDFSSPTLARRSRVPTKLEAVYRSRILSRISSGEVPLLWEGGDLFVLRMKTPVRDHTKAPLGRRRFVHACEITHMPRTRAQASVKLYKAPGDIKVCVCVHQKYTYTHVSHKIAEISP
ncbi:hypothetical protein Taro_025047, partial [Colocasia esculenta]|nr:hypothetical protein [Colocasia esculenta]